LTWIETSEGGDALDQGHFGPPRAVDIQFCFGDSTSQAEDDDISLKITGNLAGAFLQLLAHYRTGDWIHVQSMSVGIAAGALPASGRPRACALCGITSIGGNLFFACHVRA
jgi:hypothetical protein